MFSSSSAAAAARRKTVKKGLDVDEQRKKREDDALSLRKQKREESLMKRRNVSPAEMGQEEDVPTRCYQSLEQAVAALRSADPAEKLDATTYLRKLLSIDDKPPIAAVVSCGAVPALVASLWCSSNHKLQFESCWALTNIASGDSTFAEELRRHNVAPALVNLLTSSSIELRDQAVWALGNLAGDGYRLRDYVMASGVMGPLLDTIKLSTASPAQASQRKLLGNCVWALSNMFRFKPVPDASVVAAAAPVLGLVLRDTTDNEILIDAAWGLSYMTADGNDRVSAICRSGLLPSVLSLLRMDASIAMPALRTVGNVLASTHEMTQMMLDVGVLEYLCVLTARSARRHLRKEACWAVSNIAAGTHTHIDCLLRSNILPSIVDGMRNGDYDVRKEASWVVANLACGGRPDQIKAVVEEPGAVAGLCEMLIAHDVKLTKAILDALKTILRAGVQLGSKMGTSENPYANVVEECGGLDKLEELQNHENSTIYEKSVELLEEFFDAAEASENGCPNAPVAAQGLDKPVGAFGAPAVAAGFTFNF
eukprot:m51a1_g6605 putative protein (538) ;mRNA; f:8864-10990